MSGFVLNVLPFLLKPLGFCFHPFQWKKTFRSTITARCKLVTSKILCPLTIARTDYSDSSSKEMTMQTSREYMCVRAGQKLWRLMLKTCRFFTPATALLGQI